eukprot:41998_1
MQQDRELLVHGYARELCEKHDVRSMPTDILKLSSQWFTFTDCMNEKQCLLDVTVEKVPCQDEDGQRMSKHRDTFDYETVFGTNVVTKDDKQIWTFQVNSYATSTVIGITPNDRIKPNKC